LAGIDPSAITFVMFVTQCASPGAAAAWVALSGPDGAWQEATISAPAPTPVTIRRFSLALMPFSSFQRQA
jgi:hypothetical protein